MEKNKFRLTSLLTNTFQAKRLEIREAAAGADTIIVDAALQKVNNDQQVTLVTTGTYILI